MPANAGSRCVGDMSRLCGYRGGPPSEVPDIATMRSQAPAHGHERQSARGLSFHPGGGCRPLASFSPRGSAGGGPGPNIPLGRLDCFPKGEDVMHPSTYEYLKPTDGSRGWRASGPQRRRITTCSARIDPSVARHPSRLAPAPPPRYFLSISLSSPFSSGFGG
jgi:hypothetical protein